MKKNKVVHKNELDLANITMLLEKKKFFIVSISLLFMFVGFVISNKFNSEKLNKINFYIKQTPEILNNYVNKSKALEKTNINSLYNFDFHLNLLSSENLIEFAEKSGKLEELKSYLKNSNTSVNDFFSKGKGTSIEHINTDKYNDKYNIYKYTFKFDKELIGEKFLLDFIVFCKKKTDQFILAFVIEALENELVIIQENLKIAEEANIITPLTGSYDDNLFSKGTKVLNTLVKSYKETLIRLKREKISYNPLVEIEKNNVLDGSKNILISKIGISIFMGFLGFLFSSFLIIFNFLPKKIEL